MEILQKILFELKNNGCNGVKISFEDEGALLNEIITMRNLTSSIGIELSIKIGGCEAKRDIVDCINLHCDSIVAPMIESKFALKKFDNSLKQYNYNKKKGFNLETINGYNNFNEFDDILKIFDFITLGRVDFVSSLNENRSYVNNIDIYNKAIEIFTISKQYNLKCYIGGAVSIESKEFIKNLTELNLLDNFETRYIIFDVKKINFDNFEKILYLANLFELEWMKYISNRYSLYMNKDMSRIEMIQKRLDNNINELINIKN